MVAKITFPKRMEAALNYNEQKVTNGVAVCLAASGYLKEPGEMNFYQKLEGLQRNHCLNERATTKTLHVSLNFDPSEKLSEEKLSQIAMLYMERLGFGAQPYLVYRHLDAGHPHIHIVSTTIKDDGSRINTHNIGKNASEKARKEIEESFGLLCAEKRKKAAANALQPVALEKAQYGRTETKKAIDGIVAAVFQHYRFSSLPEYNAALRQFNVVADGGKEGGRIHRNGGLVYRLLDEAGNKVGVPIKASSITCSPTLKALEGKFGQAETLKTGAKDALKDTLDHALQDVRSIQRLREMLATQNIFVLPRQNGEGRLYGITFVDKRTKCVFNGSDLGKPYSAAGLQSRMALNELVKGPQIETAQQASSPSRESFKTEHQAPLKKEALVRSIEKVINLLLTPKDHYEALPQNLLVKKRKKKKGKNPNSSI
jgi:hypothetical protein